MTNSQTTDQPKQQAEDGKPGALTDVRRKLLWRIGIAGVMVVGLLGGLALFDYLAAPGEAPEVEYPKFTEPVPVPKKAVTQPVVPVEPVTPPPEEETKISEPESTGAPVDKSGRTVALPPAPEVDAVPGTTKAKPPQPVAVAEGSRAAAQPRSAEKLPPRAVESSVAAEKPATPAPSPKLLPRLLSGYSLQAGVFVDPQRAEELHARLVQEGIPATIETRVLVGPFKSRKESEAARAKLRAMGVESVPLPRNGKK
jgi:DedD protein